MKFKLPLVISMLLCVFNSFSQTAKLENVKFGDITAKDFDPDYKALDSNAQAVVLYDAGRATYEGNSDGWFNVIYTYHYRVKLINKNAFDMATIEIPLYKGKKTEDEIEKLEAATYVLENGIVTKTKVDKESIFKDKASKNYTIKKFTFPNIKEGCIIEYTYKIISPRPRDLRSFVFQGRYPVMRSEYEVTIPSLFNFIFLTGGYYNLNPIEVNRTTQNYYLSYVESGVYGRMENFTYNATNVHSKWVLTDIKPIIKEGYVTTTRNHVAKIDFQLNSLNFPDAAPTQVMKTWGKTAEDLLKDEQFGLALSEKNKWLDNDVEKLIAKNDTLKTAKNIFEFVKQTFNCTDHSAWYVSENLKKSYDSKKGNVAESNMLLTAMLKKAKINASPVLLSTRDNGVAYEAYPILDKFNYLISKVEIGGKEYLLDASSTKNGFNHLPSYCYNGYGRTISELPYVVPLFADSLREEKTTDIFIYNGNDGKIMEGTFDSNLGYYESLDLREELTTVSAKEDFFKKIKASYNFDININNAFIDSLNKHDEIAKVGYDLSFTLSDDIIYYNPLLTEAYKTNPFTAATRNYPVEMPYASKEVINFNMEIPKGYKVEELPKSARVSLNEKDGMFEYLIQADAEKVILRCVIDIRKANFDAEDYDTLREFYSYVVKKQSELIVFKKIK
jgi:Domain of Unknown Function with PDB structure (DUF3857)